MKPSKAPSIIDSTASILRQQAEAAESGSLLGSEEELTTRLSVSRATLRQVARILEREGWLTVKRGINGGYFAARPDLHTIESTVGAYLEMMDADVQEATIVGSALWEEILKKAANAEGEHVRGITRSLREKVLALRAHATFKDVLQLELDIRSALFGLINCRYIELIFRINASFAERCMTSDPGDLDNSPIQQTFVQSWRSAKIMEIAAIEDGDEELAILAARHSRNIWFQRVWGKNNF